jgi:hypothetical protein
MSAKTNSERLLELARDLSCGLMEADEQRELGRLLYDAALWAGNPLRKLSPAGALCDAHGADLGELRRAVCVVNVVGQIDGHDVVRRHSMLDVIDSRRQRLIDSQAVGNG